MLVKKIFAILIVLGLLIFSFGDTFASSDEGLVINLVPSTTAEWSKEGNQENASLGFSWRPAGDINNDGYDDIVIGIYKFDTPTVDAGRAIAFYGSEVGFAATPDWVVDGEFAADYFGVSISGVGDVNGDDFDDVLIGAHGFDGDQTIIGKAYLYYGSEAGLLTTPAWTLIGTQTNEYVGRNVSGIGDVNSDGYADIAVSAHGYDGGETDEGGLFVYYGGEDGLNSTPDWTAESNQAAAQFGLYVNGIGDANDDGYDDLIVSAPLYDLDTTDEGAVFVWYGSTSGLGDPGTPANADWRAESNQASISFGETLGSPGDVNGDGIDDVVVGTRFYDYVAADDGVVFVYYGSEEGINQGVNGTPGNVDWVASSLHSGFAFGSMTGTKANINNDDYDDLIIGCTLGAPGVYVYFGSEDGPNHDEYGNLTNADWQVTVGITQEFLNSMFGWLPGSLGDINGDGVEDIAVVSRDYQNQIGPGNEGYREGKIWAYYSKAGVIDGTITYDGNLNPSPPIVITAHPSLDAPPVAVDDRYSGETFKLEALENGSYYIFAAIDLNDSGGPPDPGEPEAFYDPNSDGVPDPVSITSFNRVTGVDITINGWFTLLPMIVK